MLYSRRQVVLVLFPDSNLKTAKRRPALVVQSNNKGISESKLPYSILAESDRTPKITL
ncbi:hypothetical protein [Anabaena sp. UHCC 0451]|uniref:hypothetical protein n=1 Tax=Anabaena sp. UHCC 0451 TaxID=2055235 RepID=UPI002B2170C8|nr:hypothetical protein [Anabaena sp. UHCC 0451]MEA5576335.1 hypothetical protein [Anabaena sp. UHCC 0451]